MQVTTDEQYLNTIEQFFLLVEHLDQFEVCLPYSRLLTGILILAVFKVEFKENISILLLIIGTVCKFFELSLSRI